MTERVCIVGCGAIGGLYAAHLAALGDVEVWAYDRSAEHVAAINRDGLRITGPVTLTARIRARTDPAEIPPCGLGIVATKGTVTGAALSGAAPIFADGAVCSVQNGIGNEEIIAEHVPRVMRGVTLLAGRLSGPGVIHLDAPGTTWIGPFEPRPARIDEVTLLAGLLTRGGMEAHGLADARGAQWTKLLFNAATNPVCALTGLTHGQMWQHDGTRRLSRALIGEGLAVAEALGIALHDDPEALIADGAKVNYHHRPSMLEDVLARRPTEITAINGGIVGAAREAGIAVPLHAAIVDLVTGLERAWAVGAADSHSVDG